MTAPIRDFVVKGVGKMMAVNVSDASLAGYLGFLGDMSVSLKFPKNKVYGGDGLWPIGTIEGDREGSIKFNNNKFNLDMLSIAMGAAITRGTSVTVAALDEAGTIPAATTYTITVAHSATALATHALAKTKVWFAGDGIRTPLVNVVSDPTTGQYSYASGVFTFAAADASKTVLIDYLYTVADGDKGLVMPTSLSVPIELWHNGTFVDDVTGATMNLQTHASNVIANGELTVDRKRGTASTHALSFDIMDPGTGLQVIDFAVWRA